MTLYRKKKPDVEAVYWNGENKAEVFSFLSWNGVSWSKKDGLVISGYGYVPNNRYICKYATGKVFSMSKDEFNLVYEEEH